MAQQPLPATSLVRSSGASDALLRAHTSNEMVFAVVGHIGSGVSTVAQQLEALLKSQRYDVHILKSRDALRSWAESQEEDLPAETRSLEYLRHLQNIGDKMRAAGDHAAVARELAKTIRLRRAKALNIAPEEGAAVAPDGALRAYILDSVRHPAEVELLRQVYQSAFTLVGVVCDEDKRIARLADQYSDAGKETAVTFMKRDAKGGGANGQRVSDAFHLADVFLDNTADRLDKHGKENRNWTLPEQLSRVLRIIRRTRVERPSREETAMYFAHGARTRSACLSRQVGAALLDAEGNIIATGTNEVPQAGGGVYGTSFASDQKVDDHRCAFGLKYCSNTKEQKQIADDLLEALLGVRVEAPEVAGLRAALKVSAIADAVRKALEETRIAGLLEFSRAVHAEMECLLAATRTGTASKGTRMFVTTFPCHYCARHLVCAGVDEVQYIEPYPKSQAIKLHSDSITRDPVGWAPPSRGGTHVLFRPFTGISPRSYERAFLKLAELKDTEGKMDIQEPQWGDPWKVKTVSYAQLEAELARDA